MTEVLEIQYRKNILSWSIPGHLRASEPQARTRSSIFDNTATLATNRDCCEDQTTILPPPTEGLIYHVQVHCPYWLTLRVADPSSEVIRVSALEGQALKSRVVGDTVTLVGGSPREWFVHYYVGAWTVVRESEVQLRPPY